MDLLINLIVFYVIFPIPALVSEILYDAVFIKREKELFNRSNYETVCLNVETDYSGELSTCRMFFLNPKCVCAYEMYILEISDICQKTEPRGSGSLYHVTVAFCVKYSYTHNGPCQNGGELIDSTDLAIYAKCSCKAGYSGDFCDTVSKSIVCTESKQDLLRDLPDCKHKFQAYDDRPFCHLTLDNHRRYRCDISIQAIVTESVDQHFDTAYHETGKVIAKS